MDLGTSGWTEFKMSEDVAAYMADNIELFDCDMQLIHSHHTLGAFFSSQDNLMLQQEGNDTNCFVSLVVDTPGNYVARVTRKVQTKSEVTVKRLGTSYEFFGEGSKEITHDDAVTTKVIDKEVIEYFDLEVKRHEVPNSLAYLDARFDEIIKKKEAKNKQRESPWKDKEENDFWGSLHQKDNKPEMDEVNLWKDIKPDDGKKFTKEWSNWKPDAKKIHAAVCKMITCDLIINPDKFDLKQWVTRHMVAVYKRLFGKESPLEAANECSGTFTEWRDFIVQFTIDNFDLDDVPDEVLEQPIYFQTSIAEAMIKELSEYETTNNPFISAYCNNLELYLEQ